MRRSFRLPRLAAALLAVGLLGPFTLPGRSEEPQSVGREQQISEVERQIAELTRKLAELKNPPVAPTAAVAPTPGVVPDEWVKALPWRSIGPANMGGRITAISVFEADPTTYWVASASGGLVKTTNNGVTFEHQFDQEATVSIGDVCVAPSNKDVVYVGTGENNPRNSVSYGDGVYKSADGGKHWLNVGLKKSYQIGKIIVHPKNPDIVYVGALGRLYGPGEERGLYKTTDGGKTWNQVLKVDDRTGVIDMRMSPADPEVLLVATWERRRDEYDGYFENAPVPDNYGPVVTHAPGTALYKTADGGKTFKKLAAGLPTVKLGRIGLDWSRKNPNVVFATVDTEKAGTGDAPKLVYMGIQGEDAGPGAKLTSVVKDGPAQKGGLKEGDVVLKIDGKDLAGYDALTEAIRARKVGDQLKLSVKRDKETLELTVTLGQRTDTGAAGGGGGAGGRQIVSAGFRAEDVTEGLKVTTVQDNSPAAKAGLKVDDVVTAADGKEVKEFRTFMQETAQEHKAGDKVKLGVLRGKDKLELTVTLAELQFGGGGGGRGGLPGGPSRDRPYSSGLGGQRANAQDEQGKDGLNTGGVFRSDDAGETWKRINSLNPRPMYFSQIRVDPSDDNLLYVCGVSLSYSTDGGKKFAQGKDRGVHSDHHALWIDPRDGRHLIIGTDGGFYVSYDRGDHWDHLNFMALGQFYHVAIDPRLNYKVYGGLQDNGSWGGPSISPRGGIVNEDWMTVGGGDGFVCRVDPTDPEQVYSESQGGAMSRRNYRTGERGFIGPRRAAAAPRHRFNWNTPFLLSGHNPSIFYCAGEQVFRSVKKGEDLKAISPELTRGKMGSGTALAESPRNPDVLWAGTDDGNLWVTRDGGTKWANVFENVKKAGLPGPRWVATIEASRYVEGRAYVCFDAHRSDDDKPYLFATEDFGETFKPVTGNLPAFGSTRCLREDIHNKDVLYCGTEFGAWASVNRGASWTRINNNLPTVAVHEFAQHPVTGEMVAATHGRSLWILDVTPLRQMSAEVVKEKAHLYTPPTAIRWRVESNRGMFSGAERKFVGENPPNGAVIHYSIAQKAGKAELKVVDYAGQTMRKLDVKLDPGLHRVVWDLARLPGGGPASGGGGGVRRGAGAGGGGGSAAAPGARGGAAAPPAAPSAESPGGFGPGGPGGFGRGLQTQPGTYRVVLTVDGVEQSAALRVEADPTAPQSSLAAEQGGDEDEDMDREERGERDPRRIDD